MFESRSFRQQRRQSEMIVGVVFLLKSGSSSITPKEYINFAETNLKSKCNFFVKTELSLLSNPKESMIPLDSTIS